METELDALWDAIHVFVLECGGRWNGRRDRLAEAITTYRNTFTPQLDKHSIENVLAGGLAAFLRGAIDNRSFENSLDAAAKESVALATLTKQRDVARTARDHLQERVEHLQGVIDRLREDRHADLKRHAEYVFCDCGAQRAIGPCTQHCDNDS